MTFGRVTETQYLIRLERGEEIINAIKMFCKKQNIRSASLSGIGSLENPTLAHYRVDNKKYSEKSLEGVFEVTSLLGTIAPMNNEPLPHLHITLGDDAMHAFAGHLVNGTVSATLEVVLTVLPVAFEKNHSEEIGLNLYTLPESLEL